MIRFFNPGLHYLKHRDEYLNEIDRVLTAGDLILRSDVDKFEQNLANYVGTKHAVAVASGTDALVLALKVLGVGPGDEVIVPSYTFRATIEAVHHAGATPVLADMGENWTLYKTPRTKAVIPAHIAGEVMDWKPKDGIPMIEDACQAIGAAPVKGVMACYSFYPAKILGCFGDGGGIATDDKRLADRLRSMRNHFKGDWKPFGFNSRLDNLQAAALNIRMKYLPDHIDRRKKIAEMYDKGLKRVYTPVVRKVYQDYIIGLQSEQERDALYHYLNDNGVETMRNGYPFPAATPKLYKASQYEASSLRIPCNPELTDEEVNTVIEKINGFFK